MIRIDALWLCTQPQDMRAGADRLLSVVINLLGEAHAHRDVKLDKLNFELARLKRWKFGAKTEAMNAQQRQMFEDALAEDEADLQAQLQALQGDLGDQTPKPRRRQTPNASPVARSCPNTCAVSSTAMSRMTPLAPRPNAASRWCVSART
jgi:hypothetical protein